MLDWLTLKPTEKKTQFYFHDDDSVEFRRLNVLDTVLMEMKNKKPAAAYKHYYKLEYNFNGYKSIPSGKVTLGYPRDVMLDLFNTLEEKDKFTKGHDLARPWITDIGANAFYRAKTQKPPGLLMDKFSTICMIIAAAEGIGIILKVLL